MYRFPEETENAHKNFTEHNILNFDVRQEIEKYKDQRFAMSLLVQIHLLAGEKEKARELS